MKLIWMLLIYFACGDVAIADPFDADEGYVNRGAPDMLGYTGLAMLMLNYVLFGVAAVVFGKALVAKAAWLQYVSRFFAKPWSFGVRKQWQQGRHWADIPLTVLLMVLWIFLCQWFNEFGLGAVAMIGLALMSVLLLKMLKD